MATTPTPSPTPAASPNPDGTATATPAATAAADAPEVAEVAEALRLGVEHHNAGRLAEARAAYDGVLAQYPEHPDALHLKGLLLFSEGHGDQAVEMLVRAIDRQPGFMAAISNLGQMLRKLNRPVEALDTFRQAAEMAPDRTAAQRDLGQAMLAGGDLAGAARHFQHAIDLDPDDFRAHVGLGLTMLRQQRLPEAAASLRHALGLRPAQWEIHLNLGVVLRMQGKIEEAIGSFRVALLLRPSYAEAKLNLGLALLEAGRLEESLGHLRAAAAEMPTRGEVHFALGQALRSTGDIDGAMASLGSAVERMSDPTEPYRALAAMLRQAGRWQDGVALERRMVARRPTTAENRIRLARALVQVGELDEAVAACQRALALDPAAVAAVGVLAAIRSVQGQVAEAREAFETVLAAQPGEPAARTSLATLRLAAGELAAGWAGFEARFELPELAAYRPAAPRLDLSGDIAGKRVLLAAEQGQGDTLQFVRYAPLLAARGAVVLLEVQAPLVPLLAGMEGVAGVSAQGTLQPAHDLACPMMSLPLVFGTTAASIPAAVPYITAPADRVAAWRGRLPDAGGRRRVGLCWSGNPGYSADAFRSIPLALLAPLLADPGLMVHLVQTDVRAGDDALIAAQDGVVDMRGGLRDFADTAAVLGEMDLVITVDTAVAHLAGALGRKVWIMLPYAADWRWQQGRADSPWYPTSRLFRQDSFSDWAGVVRDVRMALQAG